MSTLLKIENLKVVTNDSLAKHKILVSDVSFQVDFKKTFVLLGETGSGKTLTALSIPKLLPYGVYLAASSKITLLGQDLLPLSEQHLQKIRGRDVGLIFQDPMTSLNPVFTVGMQIEESIRCHQSLSRKALRNEAFRLLQDVQIKEIERVYKAYPHQLSGGMKQRVMIAIALAGSPKLLIADEPTSALDIITQTEILKLLKKIQADYNMSILLITHDLAVAKSMADEVGIMHQGKMVEQGDIHTVLENPQHEYTKKLMNANPKLRPEPNHKESELVLNVESLSVRFPIKGGLFNRVQGYVEAIKNVSFSVKDAETLAIVGESGSGKTTLAKAIAGLITPASGEIVLLGDNIKNLSEANLRQKRTDYQLIFQDPFSALDPRCRVIDSIEEGMLALDVGSDKEERLDRIHTVLEQVGLLPMHLYRYPHQLSGGQRQRVCIARALVLGPRLLICDEPTSSLDVSVQAQIIDLFIKLQQELEISYLFITHNIELVRIMAHRVAVMQSGEIIKYGSVDEVLDKVVPDLEF